MRDSNTDFTDRFFLRGNPHLTDAASSCRGKKGSQVLPRPSILVREIPRQSQQVRSQPMGECWIGSTHPIRRGNVFILPGMQRTEPTPFGVIILSSWID